MHHRIGQTDWSTGKGAGGTGRTAVTTGTPRATEEVPCSGSGVRYSCGVIDTAVAVGTVIIHRIQGVMMDCAVAESDSAIDIGIRRIVAGYALDSGMGSRTNAK